MVGKVNCLAGIKISRNRQRGSMLVLGAGVLAAAILLLGFVVNYNHWQYQKTTVADAAEAIAPIALENQYFYRIDRDNGESYKTTDGLVQSILQDELSPPFPVTTRFNFWLDDTYVGDDPDPATDRFNRIHIEVCTPLSDISGLFTLSANPICTIRVAEFDQEEIPDNPVPGGCYCEIVYCPVCCVGETPPGAKDPLHLNLCSINSGNVEGSISYKMCTGACNTTCGLGQLLGGLAGSLVTLLNNVLSDPNASYEQYLHMMKCGLGGTLRGAIKIVHVTVDSIAGTAKEVIYTPSK